MKTTLLLCGALFTVGAFVAQNLLVLPLMYGAAFVFAKLLDLPKHGIFKKHK
jgi:hypothetical protein